MNHTNLIRLFRRNLVTVVIIILFSGTTQSQEADQYINPVGDTIFVADPYILQYNDSYFLYGTTAGDGFKAWKSENLIDWSALGYVFRRKQESWATRSFWAPEVIQYHGKFYMIFSCKGPEESGRNRLHFPQYLDPKPGWNQLRPAGRLGDKFSASRSGNR